MKRTALFLAIVLIALLPLPLFSQGPVNPLIQPPNASPYGMDILGPGWQWTFPRQEASPRLAGSLRIDQADEVLQKSWAAGVRSVRVAAWWCFLEPERDQYEWTDFDIMLQLASNYGIEPMPEIFYTPYWARADAFSTGTCITNWKRNYPPDDLADWSDFITQIVQRYGSSGKNQVRYWEIWNEPGLPEFLSIMNDPGDGTVPVYADMLNSASTAIRSNDPHAFVLLGGLSDIRGPKFLGKLLDLRGAHDVRNAFDIIPFHAFTAHKVKLDLLTMSLSQRNLQYELWINELNNSEWGQDWNRSDAEIDDLFQLIFDYGVTRTFWFKSYTTKWGPGIFHNHDPLWVPGPFVPSPFYDTFQRQALPETQPRAPAPGLPSLNTLAGPRPLFVWKRPQAGSFPIAGYKLQVDDSLYQGTPYFFDPEIDVWVPALFTHFLPLQIGPVSSSAAATALQMPTVSAAPVTWLSYQPDTDLPPGPTYWRVAAVDTAGNVGPYSAPRLLTITSGDKKLYLPYQTH
ncbi:MAG: hypothetical protein GXP37_15035 [Chloroflexi bacterium]|nr:hypothetical protein [Chloroflexota bacterium]